ncbi:3',5'-cyclic-nucleotide phosphodiesterase pde1 [Lecanora helva]
MAMRIFGGFLFVLSHGSGGGPNEDNVTGTLVRSTATNWAKGSVLAVDAGTHLAAIIRIFEEHLPRAAPLTSIDTPLSGPRSRARRRTSSIHSARPKRQSLPALEDYGNGRTTPSQSTEAPVEPRLLSTGPFADLEVPFESVKANAAYFMRDLISTYLITHSHLDHISGFAINTASFQHTSRPKRVAALPSTIDAIKTHIFNDVIWPNMSDEDGGIGFVSYMRLVEGGNIQFGDGESRGYIEVCDGLAVKCWSVSHGQCMRKHRTHGSGSGSTHEAYTDAVSRRASQHAITPTALQHAANYPHPGDMMRPIDSSAFFLRDDHTGKEVLIFGDVEPDCLSLSPRTSQVWSDAATKITAGLLTGILIECSYDNSQSDETLFGHLAPRHLTGELRALAEKVRSLLPAATAPDQQEPSAARKRKRQSNGFKTHEETETRTPPPRHGRATSQSSGRKTRRQTVSPATLVSEDLEVARPARDLKIDVPESISESGSGNHALGGSSKPLQGLQVIIIHVKETLRDGPEPGDVILAQLEQAEREEGLGCSFKISRAGTSIWL